MRNLKTDGSLVRPGSSKKSWVGAESKEQIALLQWLQLQHPKVYESTFHIPNERKCSSIYGKFLKLMGVKAGVSDLFLAIPMGEYHGLFIEMKAKKGIKQPSQVKFIEQMRENGYAASFAFGIEEAMALIKWYLLLIKE